MALPKRVLELRTSVSNDEEETALLPNNALNRGVSSSMERFSQSNNYSRTNDVRVSCL